MGQIFDPRFEQDSIDSGIEQQQQETGVIIQWWFWDPEGTGVDPIYDEPSLTGGRKYTGPFPMPVLTVTRVEGAMQDTGEGAYTVDSLNLTMGYRQAAAAGLLPEADQTNQHLKDRFVYDNEVWTPSSIVSRNLLGGGGTRSLIHVTATQVRDDEMVDDPQFLKYAEKT